MNDFAHILRFLNTSLGWRLYAWLTLTILASALEGVTLGLFLPIIAGSESNAPILQVFTSTFDRLGLSYTLPLALGAMVGLYALRTVLLVLQEIYVARLISGLLVDIKSRMVDRLLRTDYQYFTGRGSGYFSNAITVEFARLADAFDRCTRATVAAAFAATYVVLALVVNPVLSIAFVILSIPAYVILRVAFRLVQRVSVLNTRNNALLQSHLLQILTGFKYLKATASTFGISRAVSSAIDEQGRLLYAQRRLESLVKNSLDLLTVLLIVALLLYYVEFVGAAFIEMVFILFILRRIVMFAQQTQRWFQQFLDASGSIRLFRDLDEEMEMNEEDTVADAVSPDFNQAIRLDGVSFAYGSSAPVLEDVTLAILPGSKVAIVGASGSGKTTLATLMTGILRPTSGEVSIGGVPYDRIDQAELRRKIGYVTQENVIFNDTVLNNVNLWDEGSHSANGVGAAARSADARGFIEDLPDGYDTLLGDNGIRISGGQRQRISIARELYKNARLLIFDEGTSALDTESERVIQKNIDGLRGDITILLIAHRLSTVRNSDMIFVLEQGRVVEQGTYDYLYALGGRFALMVDRQALNEERQRVDEPLAGPSVPPSR